MKPVHTIEYNVAITIKQEREINASHKIHACNVKLLTIQSACTPTQTSLLPATFFDCLPNRVGVNFIKCARVLRTYYHVLNQNDYSSKREMALFVH